MKRPLVAFGCLALLFACFVRAADSPTPDASKLPAAAAGAIDFARDVRPLLERSCLKCHGAEKQKGGLRLDDEIEARKGGNSGPAIQAGDGTHSRLLQLVAGLDPDLRMPPRGPSLTAAEVGRLRAWIDQGAKWSRAPAPVAAQTPRARHWAFLTPKNPPAPPVTGHDWVRNEIDTFVLARLEAEHIAPSGEAERVTLLRRVSLDLLGLPPTPEDVDGFLRDIRPDAYERLVDRLLASPHYGERWARPWLDMARYADSDGFEKDTGRPYAWRYRQWVIEALNRDLPFDQFVVEQLAGDLLPAATVEQRVATGFHRNTLTNREGGVDAEQYRVEQVVDRVNTTSKVFLGITLNCCQCHDHKFDPLTQREFYQFFAFFNSDVEVDLPAGLPAEQAAYQQKRAAFDRREAELRAALAAYRKAPLPANQRKWEESLTLSGLRKLPETVRTLLLIEPGKRTEKQVVELADFYAKTDRRLAELTKAVVDHQKAAPKITLAQTLALGAPRRTHVMIRGDFLRPGAEVEPGTPAVLPAPRSAGKRTRLDLARWIVDPANPLTARVAVNWVWERHFGRGLVATLEDFGTQGERPSHPELLDWLATELIRRQWSLKALHRLIVTSATYRQSARCRLELLARDPLNVLLARQNRLRLEAEVVRDVALASSELLDRRVGGPSVRPPQPPGISELTYAGSVRWVESTGLDRYRRGLYIWFQRTSPYPMLMTFDEPDSNVCAVRRERTNTPLQALTLMNDTVFVECAQALGRRLAVKAGKPEDRIRYGFRLCLGREPTNDELSIMKRLFDEMLRACKARPEETAGLVGRMKSNGEDVTETAAWIALARTMLNLDEFVTRD